MTFREFVPGKEFVVPTNEGSFAAVFAMSKAKRTPAPDTTAFFHAIFDDPHAWQIFASGQASGRLRATHGPDGRRALRLDYDFHGGGGFVVMRREMRFTAPDAFQISCLVHDTFSKNQLEIKWADPGNANVWRYIRPDSKPSKKWTPLRFTEREMPFAWGPAGGGVPSSVGAMEIAIVARAGGKGFVEFSSPKLRNETAEKPIACRASSHRRNHPPDAVFADDSTPGWQAEPEDSRPFWEADFGRVFRFGGLVINWPKGLPPRCFTLETSPNGRTWTKAFKARRAEGLKSHIPIANGKARFIRLHFVRASCAAIERLALRAPSFSATPNIFIHNVAADYPRGWFPRYWLREQSYWTPIGSPQGGVRALINEEGQIETDEAGFSLEPFILHGGRVITWADAKTRPDLEKGGVPVPSVTWTARGLRLEIKPWMDAKNNPPTLRIHYRLSLRTHCDDTRLIVCARPFQVTPPAQAFRNLGGQSPIREITARKNGFRIEGRLVQAVPAPDQKGAAAFEEGEIPSFLSLKKFPSHRMVHDESGLAYGAMAWAMPAGSRSLDVIVSYPYGDKIGPKIQSRAIAVQHWRKTLGRVHWKVPESARTAIDCFRTAAGHILINRDGAALQPGPRRYTRSWVRDSVIMGAALAKAGLPDVLMEFLDWYGQFQRKDGFVPCVIDRDGVDWLVEHDSHGQFLWGVREALRYNFDPDFAHRMSPYVFKAAEYLTALRRQRMGANYRREAKAAMRGLLPESASHEGYLAHPVHSYWDDFWGIRGLEAAADLAEPCGLAEKSAQWRKEADDFQHAVFRSMEKVIRERKLNYIPGSVEWADFDPTATSNAIALLDFAKPMSELPLRETLEKYLEGFRRRRDGAMPWNNYTPYEIRIIGAFVRLGDRGAANELLNFFLADRRPPEWNQWPEIVYQDKRASGHLGDIPHTWIAGEYILALASMIVSERENNEPPVLASGMPWNWISKKGGFSVKNLPTRLGPLDFHIHASGNNVIHIEIGGGIKSPQGVHVRPPTPNEKKITEVIQTGEKRPLTILQSQTIRVEALPAKLRVQLA